MHGPILKPGQRLTNHTIGYFHDKSGVSDARTLSARLFGFSKAGRQKSLRAIVSFQRLNLERKFLSLDLSPVNEAMRKSSGR
jgi:hypothetical protein